MEVGNYTMHLYCDNKDNHNRTIFQFGEPDEFTGHNRSECVLQAKQKGWAFRKEGKTICPKCTKEAKK